MNKIRLLILMLFILGVETTQQVQAQQDRFKWRLGVYGGVMNYYGELENRLFPPNPFLSDDWNTDFLAYGVSLENTFSRAWSWKIAYNKGQFIANDVRRGWDNQILTDSPNFLRGLNAKTELQDVSFSLTYFTDNGRVFGRKSFMSPYLSFGVGFTNFEVFGDLENTQGENYFYWSDLTIRNQPEGTPGAAMITQDGVFETNLTQDNPEDYNTNTLNLQAGIGLKFRLGGRFNLNLETMVRQTFTGYLDNFQSSSDAWNDIYSFTSASLHYNFGKRTQTFNSPKIYASPYTKKERAKLIDNSLTQNKQENQAFEEIETEEVALQEDSVIIFKGNETLEKLPSNQLIKGDLMPVITQYQTEGSTLLKRDTVRYETTTPQKRYIIEEEVYRPQTQDTLRFQRYVRDTVYIVKAKVAVEQPTDKIPNSNTTATYQYNPYKTAPSTYNPYQSPEINYANYSPSQANPYPTKQRNDAQLVEQNYNYDSFGNSQGRSNTNVIAPITGLGQGNTATKDTLVSNEQRLDMVEDKLDILAWNILKMQKDNGTLRLDTLKSMSNTTQNLQKVEAVPLRQDSLEAKNPLPITEEKDTTPSNAEAIVLRQQVQSLETQLATLQKEVKATNARLEPTKIGQMKINFATNVYTLSTADKAKIKEFVAERTAQKYRFLLEGYADAVGDSQQNLMLSKMRADAVRNELIALGASMAQIKTEFYGANISNSSERKVEIILMEE